MPQLTPTQWLLLGLGLMFAAVLAGLWFRRRWTEVEAALEWRTANSALIDAQTQRLQAQVPDAAWNQRMHRVTRLVPPPEPAQPTAPGAPKRKVTNVRRIRA